MNKKVLWVMVLLFLVFSSEIALKTSDKDLPAPTLTTAHIPINELPAKKHLFPVLRIIDGDTIVVDVDGVSEKIRLIGVNTPETVDPRKKVECFGKEAARFVVDTLSETSVSLEADVSQGERDRYGRLLRYAFLSDGTLLNKIIIAEGYGYEYTYRIPYRYMEEFKDAERTARKLEKGLWAKGVCE